MGKNEKKENNGVNHNVFNKIAVINDMTGFGRCSIAVEMPIISHFGIQCCPVPTSIFSNHSGYSSFFFQDYTDFMEPYVAEWKKLELKFDGILTGFYGSARQINLVENFIDEFSRKDTVVIVDPIMGDEGTTYSTYTAQMCEKMKELTKKADIITPNLTELCILSGVEYREDLSFEKMEMLCRSLSDTLKKDAKMVVTGIKRGMYLCNYVFENDKGTIIRKKSAGDTRCGTGDVFASIIAADAVRGVEFTKSVKKAADFICECIKESDQYGIPKTDGVCFEKVLHRL